MAKIIYAAADTFTLIAAQVTGQLIKGEVRIDDSLKVIFVAVIDNGEDDGRGIIGLIFGAQVVNDKAGARLKAAQGFITAELVGKVLKCVH